MKTCFWLGVLLALLVGCESECEKTEREIQELNYEKANHVTPLLREMDRMRVNQSFASPIQPLAVDREAVPEGALATTAAADRFSAVVLKSRSGVEESDFGFPNASFGKFTAQVTVVPIGRVGLVDGKSMSFLEYRQAKATGGPRRYFIGSVYDAALNGFRVVVGDPKDGTELGPGVSFANQIFVDLRIEQTAAELQFSARETPSDQAAGGWTLVHSVALSVDPAPFYVAVGIRNTGKGAQFALTHFAVDGDAIGGHTEYPLIAKIRDSQDLVKAALAKLTMPAPDLNAVSADLDAALMANEEADAGVLTGLGTLQTRYALIKDNQRLLGNVRTGLMRALAAVETGNIPVAKAQAPKLAAIVTYQNQAMGQFLGLPVPRLKVKPDLFSVRIP